MAQVNCKECNKWIYEFAETCPHCGIKEPGVSLEEEELLRDIALEDNITKSLSNTADGLRQGWLERFIHRKSAMVYEGRAEWSKERSNELRKELNDLRERKIRK